MWINPRRGRRSLLPLRNDSAHNVSADKIRRAKRCPRWRGWATSRPLGAGHETKTSPVTRADATLRTSHTLPRGPPHGLRRRTRGTEHTSWRSARARQSRTCISFLAPNSTTLQAVVEPFLLPTAIGWTVLGPLRGRAGHSSPTRAPARYASEKTQPRMDWRRGRQQRSANRLP